MNATMYMLWLCCGRCGMYVNISHYENPITPTSIAVYSTAGVSCLLIGLINVVLNTIFLISISQEKTLQTTAMKFCMALAIVDILQGLITAPSYGIYLLKMTNGELDCLLNSVMLMLGFGFGCMNVSSIFVIVLSQYLSIIYPIRLRTRFPVLAILIPLFITNALCFLSLAVSLFITDYFQLLKLILGVITATLLILMCFFYFHLAITVGKSKRKIIPSNISNDIKNRLIAKNQNYKLAKTAMIILCSFMACYAPLIMFFTFVGTPSTYIGLYVEIMFNIFVLCNSVVDYFVYYWRIKDVRLAVKRMMTMIVVKMKCQTNEDGNGEQTTSTGFQMTN